MNNFMNEAKKIITHLNERFNHIRTGMANPSLLGSVRVNFYGNPTPLNQVANVSCPDATLILVKPYDKSSLKDIEKGIIEANLGVNPIINGDNIMIGIPPLTEETRKKLVKDANDEAEKAKISVRLERQKAMDDLKTQHKEKLITEDELERDEKKLQDEVNLINKEIDEKLKLKQTQLMQV